jgi:pentose-5-phosphate-3-epimerase
MKILRTASVAFLAVATMSLSPAFAGQPNMKAALEHLRSARAALERAEHNKAGHRERAIELVDKAIAQVQAGMAAAR